MVASGEVTNLFFVATRTLMFSEIAARLEFREYYDPAKYESARNPRIQLLVSRNLDKHPFRVHKNAAPLKQVVAYDLASRAGAPSAFTPRR